MTAPGDATARNPLRRSDAERVLQARRVVRIRSVNGAVGAASVALFGTWLVVGAPVLVAVGAAIVAAAVVGGAHELWRRRHPPVLSDPHLVELVTETDDEEEDDGFDVWAALATAVVVVPFGVVALVVSHWPAVLALGSLTWATGADAVVLAISLGAAVATDTAWELLALPLVARRWDVDLDLV